MKIIRSSLLLAILLLFSFAFTDSKAEDIVDPPEHCRNLSRSSFPAGFIFGTASSAYQFEGAAREGGRGLSIWDTYTHTHPERIADGSNGDVALDQYHRYQEDVGIMKSIGLDSYRFSISWSRVLPYGTLSGGVNREGIKYYNNLINELISRGINMSVTLFHWDLPQALQDQFGGFLSPQIAIHFRDYAKLCFQEFGDRIKHWVTLNEPYVYSYNGYVGGSFAPGRCSYWQPNNCTGGDSSTEPYLVAHHLLISHAAAVNVYRTEFQAIQGGQIGIVLLSHWFEPASNTTADQNAASRALDFMYGWSIHPVATGQYPKSMESLVGDRLPTFTERQSALLNGSYDFLGINYYTSRYAANAPANNSLLPSYITDSQVNQLTSVHGVPIGPTPGIDWLYVYPQGIRDLLVYTKENYNNPPIYITENGVAEMDDPTLTLEQALNDTNRVSFYSHHLCNVQAAITNASVNMKGYYVWSLLDNFEWSSGYTARFGINYVNYTDNLSRHKKLSANWLADFLKN